MGLGPRGSGLPAQVAEKVGGQEGKGVGSGRSWREARALEEEEGEAGEAAAGADAADAADAAARRTLRAGCLALRRASIVGSFPQTDREFRPPAACSLTKMILFMCWMTPDGS